jgi:hypothetical protein
MPLLEPLLLDELPLDDPPLEDPPLLDEPADEPLLLPPHAPLLPVPLPDELLLLDD